MNMTDFAHPVLNWLIIGGTVFGFVGLIFLIRWMSSTSGTSSDQPETMGHVWDEDLEEYNNPLPRWWLNLFYLTLIFGAVYLALFPGLGTFPGLLNWTSTGKYEAEIAQANAVYAPIFDAYLQDEIPDLATNSEALDIGRRLYLNYCATCHGSDAGGVRGFPNLRDHDWLYGGAPEQITQTISQGRQGIMPGWKDILDRESIFNVTQYVRSLGGNPIDPAVKIQGQKVYEANCVVCHGADGTGNQMMGAPNLADNIWLYGGSQRAVLKSVEVGRSGRMPAHDDFLGEAKIHLLAAYIYSLSHLGDPVASDGE